MNDRDKLLKLTAATREYDSPVDEARAFLQYIENLIDNSLSSTVFTLNDKADLGEKKKAELEKEKAELERARRRLRLSFDELTKCFFDPLLEQKPSLREFGYYSLWKVMGAAFVAGSRGTLSAASRKATKSIEQLSGSRSKKTKDRRQALIDFLEKEGYPRPWPKSRDFAETIRPSFLESLGIKEDREKDGKGYDKTSPRISTIKGYLMKISNS